MGAAVAVGLAVACGWFNDDPVAELAAEVIDAPVTTLARADTQSAPEIPPLRPGELVRRDGAAAGLQVLAYAPEGAGRDPSQVAVVFDRPMAPLTALADDVPVACTPGIEGRMRWAGTSTAVIVPTGNRFPAATEYRCEVPAGTAALDGTALVEPVRWSFSTEAPALRRSWPSNGEREWSEDAPLVLRFNQEVEAAALAPFLSLTDGQGHTLPVVLSAATGGRASPETIQVEARLARDTAYVLTVAAGLMGAEGPLPSAAATQLSFHTTPALAISRQEPAGANVSPDESLQLSFTTPVDGKIVASHVHLSPPPPDGWKPPEGYESRWWYYGPRLLPRTTYTVTVDPGITDIHGQTLTTGASWQFTTGDLEPTLDTPWSASDLYPAANPPTLPIRFRNVSQVTVEIERLDPVALVHSAEAWSQRLEARGASRRLVLAAGGPPNVLQRAMVDLGPELVGGFGLLRVRGSAPEVRDWNDEIRERAAILQVTDLGVTLKVTPEGATLWVTRLSDGAPVRGAAVSLIRGGRDLWAGSTDASGLAEARGEFFHDGEYEWSGDELLVLVQSGDDSTIVAHRMTDGLASWQAGVNGSFDPVGSQLVIEGFTDRGVYKAGDTVHVAVSARVQSMRELVAPSLTGLSWTFQDPDGATVAEGACHVTHGDCSFDVSPPADASLGNWWVELTAKNADGSQAGRGSVPVPVLAYRAPSFRVDVSAPERASVGDALRGTVQARYLFGSPMKGAKVRWAVRRSPRDLEFDGLETFRFAAIPDTDAWAPVEASVESIQDGQGEIGADGGFTITQALAAESLAGPFTYLLEATVTDTDRQQVTGRATVNVDSAAVYVGARTREWLGEAGKPVSGEFVAVDPSGKSVAGTSIKVSAIRRDWKSVRERGVDGTWHWVSTHADRVVESTSIKSGSSPVAWSFSPAESGLWLLRAETSDRAGRTSIAEDTIWISGGDVGWARSDGNRLDLVADRKEYSPGKMARILVKAPKKGMQALVTVEREGIWTRRVVTLASNASTVEVPITAEMVPNAFVSVVAAEGAPGADQPGAGVPAVWYGATELRVSAEGQHLAVSLQTDRESYQPRDEVTVNLSATRDGKPAANAHVVLWAVDYGVLSLTAYQTPNLHERFYRPRWLGVLTADNRVSVYDRATRLAKGAEIGGDGGGGFDGDLRTRFVTTPLWEAGLSTDANGRLTHRFSLPDNLTTFRVMAVVSDGGPAFGNAETELRVNRPLIARPALPRFFRDGDRVLAGVVVHNNTPTPADITVQAAATGATLKGAPRTVSVAPDGAVEVPFAITGFDGKEVKFRFEAEGGGNRDAVESSVPVRAARPSEVVATAGSVSPGSSVGSVSVQVEVPKDALRSTGGLSVNVSASALVGAGASVDYVVGYPHGCLEQTASRTRVALRALQLRERAGVTSSEAQLREWVGAGISRLAAFRTADGGYAYWPGDRRMDALATSYALELLSEAREAGRPVDARDLDLTAARVREVLEGRHLPDWLSAVDTDRAGQADSAAQAEGAMRADVIRSIKARAALALARAGKGDAAYTNRMLQELPAMPEFSRAQMLETLARTRPGDSRIAGLTRELESRVSIEATTASLVDRDRGRWEALWWGEDIATIELVRALNVARPDHPLMERLVAHLVQARREGRWSNTWATAEALTALGDYSRQHEGGAVSAQVSFGGAPLIAKDLGLGGTAQADVPITTLRSAPLVFDATGGRLYYESRLAYALPALPPRDEGFTIERSMAVLEGAGAGSGRIEPGSIVRVTLRVVTPVDRYNVAVVDPVPAGIEPVDSRFATERTSYGGDGAAQGDTGYRGRDTAEPAFDRWWWSAWVFNRRELRDDEVIFYADYMPAGVHSQSWIGRATTPGSYAHPAATATSMYAPDVYGRTEAGRFVVGWAVAQK